MALPDKHQLKFNIHKDSKSLMEAIEKRFGGNKETKKVEKTLLKQQYKNFTGLSSERLDQIHDMLQKLISQLEILGVIDSGCSRHMTRNISYLFDFEEINGGYVAFGGNPKGGKITSKGKIKTGKLDFDDVYFVKELKFNLFSVCQMCYKKNSVLFTDTECVVLSSDFKLPDETHVLLRVPRENNMYNKAPSFVQTSEHVKTTRTSVKPVEDPTQAESLRKDIPKSRVHRHSWKRKPYFVCKIVARNQPNSSTCIQENLNAGKVGKEYVSTQQYVLLPLWSTGFKDPHYIDVDAAFDDKETESEVYVSPSSSDKPKKHDGKEEGIDYEEVFAPVARIEAIWKFGLPDGETSSTPIDTEKPLLKDPDGLWYPKDSPFNLVAYSDSDYVGASLDRKSTTGGYQFLEKPRKGQNRIKTGQKWEAWGSREKVKAVTVDRGRKTEQNAKRMAKNANTIKGYSKFKERRKEKGPDL
uniref:Ribonuclease H-like domain-containing protein n=1 Tax=Tanacetum cinerariifolium TaxID=118510 RepID=A0A6L2N8P4_TANCI|nr:ribonuclease H-like domain-containing protein [Tanacetum cinerariifolium]